MTKPSGFGFFIVGLFALAACGGGGGGGTSGGSVSVLPTSTATPTPTPTATPTVAPLAISGTVEEFTSGAALAGFTVTVGQVPPAATCLNAESNTSMPCGVPAAPTTTATTSPNGAFSVPAPTAGTYMLTIGKDATYATLHRTISVTSTGLALGTLKVAALSSDEQAWVVDVNLQRATVSVPVSFSNLVVDEYAEEQARAEVAAIVSGAQPYGDATEELYGSNYSAESGAMYQTGGVADLVGSAGAYLQADLNWMVEKANCPGGNWQTCTATSTTGHYQNISDTQNVWIGVGESATSYDILPYGTEWAYALIIPVNYESSYPASTSRATVASLR